MCAPLRAVRPPPGWRRPPPSAPRPPAAAVPCSRKIRIPGSKRRSSSTTSAAYRSPDASPAETKIFRGIFRAKPIRTPKPRLFYRDALLQSNHGDVHRNRSREVDGGRTRARFRGEMIPLPVSSPISPPYRWPKRTAPVPERPHRRHFAGHRGSLAEGRPDSRAVSRKGATAKAATRSPSSGRPRPASARRPPRCGRHGGAGARHQGRAKWPTIITSFYSALSTIGRALDARKCRSASFAPSAKS
jgi:hypothetical protein